MKENERRQKERKTRFMRGGSEAELGTVTCWIKTIRNPSGAA